MAIRTGNGLFVLDIDSDDGEQSLSDLETEHGKLPNTWEVLTGRGRHIYFACPANISIRASKIGKDLEIRGEGRYVVAPPSEHYSGRKYEWEVCHEPTGVPLTQAPEWLLALVTKKTEKRKDKQKQAQGPHHNESRKQLPYQGETKEPYKKVILEGERTCEPPQ